ncbi:hypothetical protein V8E54_013146 [Elaphomyces granulatus]
MNQLLSRKRGFEPDPPLMDPSNGVPNDGWGENLAELEQRALAAKREAQAKRKQIPPFVQKLRSFLDESKNTDLIRWSDDGNSFIVLDEDEFAKSLIPELFKHNNYASFVRQLNMYGFHKKVGLSDNSMRASERKNKSPSEYVNPYFKRGHPDLLWLIQKPKNAPAQGSTSSGKGVVRVKAEDVDENDGDDYVDDGTVPRDDRARPRGQLSLSQCYLPKEQLAGVYGELQAIRQQQQIISNTISKLRREHEQLYVQAANFQEQHTRHENSINAILKFLASFYDLRLQSHDRAQNLPNSFSGAISEDIDDTDQYALSAIGSELNRRFKKPPLLLKAPPPQQDPPNRTNTLSPSVGSTYDRSPHPRASPLPNNYSARLANTREAINSLAKMQAEQDRSVQNLTNLLQPLSPSGTIPGLTGDLQGSIPPSLDLDQIFNSNDYFTDIPDMDKSAFGFGDAASTALNQSALNQSALSQSALSQSALSQSALSQSALSQSALSQPEPTTTTTTTTTGEDPKDALFDFNSINTGTEGDIFSDPTSLQNAQGNSAFFDNYGDFAKVFALGLRNGTGAGADSGLTGHPIVSNDNDLGRIIESFTDSEATSPSTNTIDEKPQLGIANVTGDPGGQYDNRSNVKRRKKG